LEIYSKSHITLSKNGLNYTQIDFYEQAKHIRGLFTNFTISPQPLQFWKT
jgi:hypothetical protein